MRLEDLAKICAALNCTAADRNLPRPRGAAAPYLRPRRIRRPVDDPRICPAIMPGQQTLFPVRRRLEREHARRINGRISPEESAVWALAEERAAAQGLSATWSHMVMRIIRCALAIRDAEEAALLDQEMLDQVRLPLKGAAAEHLGAAGHLEPGWRRRRRRAVLLLDPEHHRRRVLSISGERRCVAQALRHVAAGTQQAPDMAVPGAVAP
ncbi:hypothetical protein ACIBUR_03120 [Streptomyces anulatus]